MGFSPIQKETFYFFDTQNRLDSIAGNYTFSKIIYNPDGAVEKRLNYKKNSPQILSSESQYMYENGKLARIVTTYFGSITWNTTYHYEWHNNGFLRSRWFEGGNDKTVFTRDGCGNVIKEQDFYHVNNEEHRLAIAEFDGTFSPYYLIGLHRIFPEDYSVYNPVMNQIVHWDCGDYDPSPIHHTYEYNAEGLPVKMANAYRMVEFFYE